MNGKIKHNPKNSTLSDWNESEQCARIHAQILSKSVDRRNAVRLDYFVSFFFLLLLCSCGWFFGLCTEAHFCTCFRIQRVW